MGNQNSHGNVLQGNKNGNTKVQTQQTNGSKKEKPLSRSPSGSDIQEKYSPHLLPIDKLAKILQKKCQQEEHVQGITESIFAKYVFPRYDILAKKLFAYFRLQSKTKTQHLSISSFRNQSEKFLTVLEDNIIVELYVKMYSENYDGENGGELDPENLKLLLMTTYRVAMDHYSEGPQMCLHTHNTLTAIVDSCFHQKKKISAQYITNWILAHCPRLLLPLHRYAVHRLATGHRILEMQEDQSENNPNSGNTGIELATPVLEHPPPFASNSSKKSTTLLPMSRAWLLAGALPPLYSRPREAPSPVSSNPISFTNTTTTKFLSKLIAAVPSHWVQLYSSEKHGHGANRFLHHVLNYRGPTVVLLSADCGAIFCIACPSEWHESHLYWGSDDCVILRIYPSFCVIERGPKMLFLNTTIRGYPTGLRAGKDPRKPIISVDGGFDKMECQSIPYQLASLEVWGCGDQTQRETQLDIKKWQVKEAERQRCVKLSAADWLDHPDRYLLELAGRPQYNNSQTQSQ